MPENHGELYFNKSCSDWASIAWASIAWPRSHKTLRIILENFTYCTINVYSEPCYEYSFQLRSQLMHSWCIIKDYFWVILIAQSYLELWLHMHILHILSPIALRNVECSRDKTASHINTQTLITVLYDKTWPIMKLISSFLYDNIKLHFVLFLPYLIIMLILVN